MSKVEEAEVGNKEEMRNVFSQAGRYLVLMLAHLFRGKGSMFLPGVAILIALSFVTRHPLFAVLTVLILIRGYLALTGEKQTPQ